MKRKRALLVLLTVAAFAALLACGGDGGGGGGFTPAACGSTCVNVAGNWSINETLISDTCGDWTPSSSAFVAQSGCAVSITVSGVTGTGCIIGQGLSASASYPDSGFITTVNVILNMDGSGTTITDGTSSWSWSGGCSGSSSITGTKN